jgi:phosphoserine phosphatase
MDEPGALLGRINTLVHDDVRGGRFVTLALAIVDAKRSRVDLISAGHGPCFLLHSDTGEVEQFGGDGVPLGILADETYGSARTIEMKPGDVLLLVTDGFFEWQRAGDGEQYGTDRLADLLRRVGNESGESILSQLDVSVQSFANGSKQADDVTGVVIKRARA